MGKLELSVLSHVTLNVTDIEKSMAFYEGFLGLERLFCDELPHGMGYCSGLRTQAGVSIELLQLAGPDGHPNTVNTADQCSRLVFSVADFDATKGILAQEGIVEINEMELDGIKMLFIQDPDGRTIEITQFPNNNKTVANMHGY